MIKIKSTLIFVFFLIFLSSFISADMVNPGTKYLQISNIITNFNDFPDYILLSSCKMGSSFNLEVINGGIIGASCYKYSTLDVYAIKKIDFNQTYLNELKAINNYDLQLNATKKYFESFNSIKVITGIETLKSVPISSTENSVTNYYNISLDSLQDHPSKKIVERNNLIYFYLGIPLLALIILAFVLIRRKNGPTA